MSGVFPVLFGVAIGYGLGWVTWVVTGRFIFGYRNQLAASQEVARPEEADTGSIFPGVTLVSVAMALWGGYVGRQASSVAALFLLLTRRAGRKDTIAYGPYLALGAWLVLTRVLGLWPGKL